MRRQHFVRTSIKTVSSREKSQKTKKKAEKTAEKTKVKCLQCNYKEFYVSVWSRFWTMLEETHFSVQRGTHQRERERE